MKIYDLFVSGGKDSTVAGVIGFQEAGTSGFTGMRGVAPDVVRETTLSR